MAASVIDAGRSLLVLIFLQTSRRSSDVGLEEESGDAGKAAQPTLVTQSGLTSRNPFYVGQLPVLVEPRLKRTVKSEDCEPAFARNSLDPVDPIGRPLGAEVDINRPISIRLRVGLAR